jgi:peptidoglycan/xylan/chitin deacetylase (PgdA/CDA1 family)
MKLYATILIFFVCVVGVLSAQNLLIPEPVALKVDDNPVAIPIFIYHAIRPTKPTDTPFVLNYVCTPETLETELKWLKTNNYESISFDDLVAHFKQGKVLPQNPVILSFDDSWEDQYIYGVPLLEKYSFKGTFFIIVGSVGTKHQMTWEEIRMLDTMGMEIGCHTYSHPFLTQLTTPRRMVRLNKELVASKKILEAAIGHPVNTFAYPYGQYNDIVIEQLKEAGYTSARGTFPGILHGEKDLFTLTGLIRTENMAYFTNDLNEYFGELGEIAQ